MPSGSTASRHASARGVSQVSVRARGQELIVAPIGRTWDSFFLRGPQVSDDFLPERVGQFQQAREAL